MSTPRELDPVRLRDAIVARLPHRSAGSGELRWPAVPALIDHYENALLALFAGLGSEFNDEDRSVLHAALELQLSGGFAASPFSKLIVSFRTDEPPNTGIVYDIKHEVVTVEDEYDAWLKTRKPPLFGTHPDAKLVSLAHALGEPHEVAILDVGAGTGRNTIALAKAGFAVDAVELVPSLAAVLQGELDKANLGSRVFVGDALAADSSLDIPKHKYQLVVLAEVVASHFRDTAQVRRLFELASEWLAPSGLLLFNAFLAADGYEPDVLAKQASQVFWSCLFTREEFEDARRGLPLSRVSDESTYAFEKQHLPKEAWPPTGWFGAWARGYDLFQTRTGRPPHELRWITYRKTEQPEPPSSYVTSVSLHVQAPRERVFDAVLDPSLAPSLFRAALPLPGIKQQTLDAPAAQRRTVWSDGSVTVEDIVSLERPLRHAYRWTNTLKGPLRYLFKVAEADWTFVSTPSGTGVYWSCRFEPRHRWLARGMNIVQGAFQRWMQASLQALRQQLERADEG
jgi:SAM-dependent methyltransferase